LKRFSWRTFGSVLRSGEGGVRPVSTQRRAEMAWKAPKIVEVPVGMEINMYACAARK
jgi:coenzyme PQQ precursor peptide PqqA